MRAYGCAGCAVCVSVSACQCTNVVQSSNKRLDYTLLTKNIVQQHFADNTLCAARH